MMQRIGLDGYAASFVCAPATALAPASAIPIAMCKTPFIGIQARSGPAMKGKEVTEENHGFSSVP
jgi:hypothetical protein